MDDLRVGAAFRAVRLRRGWRQTDVGDRAGLAASVVSLLEHGHTEKVSFRAMRLIAGVLGIRLELTMRMPHGELDRLLNAGHAALHESLARYFKKLPEWVQAPEVSFAFYGERGVIDILAFHAATGSLLVIELKTELVSLEELLMTMDVRTRHAIAIARQRGWNARSVSAWVIFAESRTTRRRVAAHSAILRSAFPADGRSVAGWLARPEGVLKALSFWTDSNVAVVRRNAGAPRRVRQRGKSA